MYTRTLPCLHKNVFQDLKWSSVHSVEECGQPQELQGQHKVNAIHYCSHAEKQEIFGHVHMGNFQRLLVNGIHDKPCFGHNTCSTSSVWSWKYPDSHILCCGSWYSEVSCIFSLVAGNTWLSACSDGSKIMCMQNCSVLQQLDLLHIVAVGHAHLHVMTVNVCSVSDLYSDTR